MQKINVAHQIAENQSAVNEKNIPIILTNDRRIPESNAQPKYFLNSFK